MYPSHVGNTYRKYAACMVVGGLIQPSNSHDQRKHLRGECESSPKRQHTVELLIVGSNANNGSQCGLSYANSNNGFSNSNTNIGARLKIYTGKNWRRRPRYGLVARLSLSRWRVSHPTEQRQEALGMREQSQQSPAVQVSKAVVRLYRKLGSHEV